MNKDQITTAVLLSTLFVVTVVGTFVLGGTAVAALLAGKIAKAAVFGALTPSLPILFVGVVLSAWDVLIRG